MVESGLKMEKIFHVTSEEATEPLIKENPKDPRNRRIAIVVLREAGKDLKASGSKAAGKPRPPLPDPMPRARPVIPARLERPASEIGGADRNRQTRFHFAIFTNIRGKLFPSATKLYIHRE